VDLKPTPEQARFVDELRTWLQSNLPWEYGVVPPPIPDLAERVAEGRTWQRRLADALYVAVAWPAD
jgi:hypothetical protein